MTSTTPNDRPGDDEFDAIYDWDGGSATTFDVVDALVRLTETGFSLDTAGRIWALQMGDEFDPTLTAVCTTLGMLADRDHDFTADVMAVIDRHPDIGYPDGWHDIVDVIVRRVVPCDADRNAVHSASDAAADLVHRGANPAIIGSLVGALLAAYTPGELELAGD
jgi:hypothetical protein